MKCLLCNKRIPFWKRKNRKIQLHSKCYDSFFSKVFNGVLEGLVGAFKEMGQIFGDQMQQPVDNFSKAYKDLYDKKKTND